MTTKTAKEAHRSVTMIHPGVSEITVPARRELQEVPNPSAGEGAVKIEEVEVEKERTEKVKFPPGTRFGEYLIKTPYQIDDPDLRKRLAARGFKVGGKDEVDKLTEGSVERTNEEQSEFDRKRAAVKVGEFEPSAGLPAKDISDLREEIKAKEGKK